MATCQELLAEVQVKYKQLLDDQILSLGPKFCPDVPPPSQDNLLYDSNFDIDWAKVDPKKKYTVYGDISKPGSKYIYAAASGHPYFMFLPETKEIILIHKGKFGRLYFGVLNYECRLETDFMIDSCKNGPSWKDRNRHQFHRIEEDAPDTKAQGGVGCGLKCDSVDDDIEIAHDLGEDSGPQKGLRNKLEPNKYYHLSFSQWDSNDKGKIEILVKIDGEIVNSGKIPTQPQMFNKSDFMTWSEFWVRYNAKKGGKLTFKNLQLFNIGVA